MTAAPEPPTPPDEENRATLRKPVRLSARLRDRSMSRFEVAIVDLSRTGFRGETIFTLHPGTIVWITLPGLSGLEAEIAWHHNDQFGARFQNPLHPAVFDHIVALSALVE